MASFVTQGSWSSGRLTVQLDVISDDYVRTYECTRVTTTAAPAVNQVFKSYPLLQSMLSLDILVLL